MGRNFGYESATKHALVAFGLMVFWFIIYVIASTYAGSDYVPHTPGSDYVPSRLFAAGGVFGMQRPMIEVAWRTTCAGLCGVAALAVCDLIYARHTNARYFALHVICNCWISLLCLPDLYHMVIDPIGALSQRVTTNHWPTCLVFSIHVYHMLAFRGLQWIDWLHHILMVVIGAPLLITGEVGPLMNFNNFFMCGVPGGLDYAMLFAVKHGWMSPLQEKKYNSSVNVWIREPSLVCTATLGYLQIHLQPSMIGWLCFVRGFLCLLACWNGLFFMERVVGNYHVCSYKAKLARTTTAATGQGPMSPPSAYETEEHLAVGLPGMGMRISVSHQELRAIEKEKEN